LLNKMNGPSVGQKSQSLQIILDNIYKKSPFQKKRIEKYLSQRDEHYFTEAEEFYRDLLRYLKGANITLEYVVEAYIKFCQDTVMHQIDFMKTGKYPMQSFAKAFEQVYDNDEEMSPYMLGLAVSLFLWKQHYEIFKFFSRHVAERRRTIGSYLEIGPGHGLYLKKALGYCHDDVRISMVDISKTSIRMTCSVINYFYPHRKHMDCHVGNILELSLDQYFDFITAGEIIEHLEKPEEFLRIIKKLLAPEGSVFLSTCINASEVDHIYQFESVEEITGMIERSGFKTADELTLPSDEVSLEEAVEKKLSVNYCALLNHR